MSRRSKNKAPTHVCSLSMSALNDVQNAMKDVEKDYRTQDSDIDVKKQYNVLRWTKLSMEYNRFSQLQFVYNHLGDKGNSPEFRIVRMKPVFRSWKREVLRLKWREVRKALDAAGIEARLSIKKNSFNVQRAKLAERSISALPFLSEAPLSSIIDVRGDIAGLLSFQSPSSVQPGFFNKGYDFVGTEGVKTISDVESDEEGSDDMKREIDIETVKSNNQKPANEEKEKKKNSRWWW